MTKEKVMLDLYEVCRLGLYKLVPGILEEHREEIDFDLHGVQIFEFIIGDKETKTLSELLDFYMNTKLQGDPSSLEYKLAYKKLQRVLEEAAEANTVVPAIERILAPYLNRDEDSDDEQDLSGFEDIIDELNHGAMIDRSHSESDLVPQHKQAASKLLLHSSSESLLSALDSSGSDAAHVTSNLGKESGLFTDL